MAEVSSVEVTNPFHVVLLENEPLLNHIEDELTIPRETFQFIQRKFITSEDPTLLKHCMIVLKKMVEKYNSVFFKVKIVMKYNEELVMTHLTTLSEFCPIYRGLKFRRLPIPPQDDIFEYVVYGLLFNNDIIVRIWCNGLAVFQKTINQINNFCSYYELIELPTLFRSNFIEICSAMQRNYISSIPSKFDTETPPSLFGFEHNFKPFLALMTQLQKKTFPCVKLNPTKALTIFHKQFYDERFKTLTTLAAWELKTTDFKIIFTETKKGIYDAFVKAASSDVKKIAAELTEFFNGIVLVVVMKTINKKDEKDLLTFSRMHETPFDALYLIDYGANGDQMVAVINLAKSLKMEIGENYKDELTNFIYGMYANGLDEKEEFQFEELDMSELLKKIPQKQNSKIDKQLKKEEERRKKEEAKRLKEQQKKKGKKEPEKAEKPIPPPVVEKASESVNEELTPNKFVEYDDTFYQKRYENAEFEKDEYYNKEYQYQNYAEYESGEQNTEQQQSGENKEGDAVEQNDTTQNYLNYDEEYYDQNEEYYDQQGEGYYDEQTGEYYYDQYDQQQEEEYSYVQPPPLPTKPKRFNKEEKQSEVQQQETQESQTQDVCYEETDQQYNDQNQQEEYQQQQYTENDGNDEQQQYVNQEGQEEYYDEQNEQYQQTQDTPEDQQKYEITPQQYGEEYYQEESQQDEQHLDHVGEESSTQERLVIEEKQDKEKNLNEVQTDLKHEENIEGTYQKEVPISVQHIENVEESTEKKITTEAVLKESQKAQSIPLNSQNQRRSQKDQLKSQQEELLVKLQNLEKLKNLEVTDTEITITKVAIEEPKETSVETFIETAETETRTKSMRRPTRKGGRKPPTKELLIVNKTMKTEEIETASCENKPLSLEPSPLPTDKIEEKQNSESTVAKDEPTEEGKVEAQTDGINESASQEVQSSQNDQQQTTVIDQPEEHDKQLENTEQQYKEETPEVTISTNENVEPQKEVQQEDIPKGEEGVPKEEQSFVEDSEVKETYKRKYSNPNQQFMGEFQNKIHNTQNLALKHVVHKENVNENKAPVQPKVATSAFGGVTLKKSSTVQHQPHLQDQPEETELQKVLKKRRGNN
ncbi:caldesmon, putative [Entamoeba invadens IP1]|uniref:Caldesmon, putative n=1 Tax=Entamoeba invadens IP1 TaxID=370355 RepID=A0A0A1U3P6_ENTIV|nr:caldesmon, putative [Entamoeba invadens IP1]ELP88849.1 caldesmon, putative [Entamoeba invadens IP1]|eukprot:XP_004255620.1 caldesmon, putative [Entamoeba invadens IP1]